MTTQVSAHPVAAMVCKTSQTFWVLVGFLVGGSLSCPRVLGVYATEEKAEDVASVYCLKNGCVALPTEVVKLEEVVRLPLPTRE